MSAVAAIAFTPASPADSPNLKASSRDDALATFHRLIELCFASLRRWNPELSLVLVTTEELETDTNSLLDRLGVAQLIEDFKHRPPEGFYPTFNASLFSIDAMSALAHNYPDSKILLLDPDVVCTNSLGDVFSTISENGYLAYNTEFPPTEISQGLSAQQAGKIHAQLEPNFRNVPLHYGGELYGFTSKGWASINSEVERAWRFSLEEWHKGTQTFVTEEHLLNFALRYVPVAGANSYIRRIWTAPTYRTVRSTDSLLPLWHLPAEKHRGLTDLHRFAADPMSWFWSAEMTEWRTRSARTCGLGRRSLGRWTWDRIGSIRPMLTSLRT